MRFVILCTIDRFDVYVIAKHIKWLLEAHAPLLDDTWVSKWSRSQSGQRIRMPRWLENSPERIWRGQSHRRAYRSKSRS